MTEKQVNLSERLRMLASMVTPGNRVTDVGCDHGFLPIFLVQGGVIPSALAMDVGKGPLEAAREHIKVCGLEKYIATRLSDGLREFQIGEAETVVCSGMGGRLMEKILRESMDKARSVKELILQPQSELGEFRAFLRRFGFEITEEDAVFEDGKYYFAMKAVYSGRETAAEPVFDCFGEKLLLGKHPVLKQFLDYRLALVERLREEVPAGSSGRADERLRELLKEQVLLEKALAYFA